MLIKKIFLAIHKTNAISPNFKLKEKLYMWGVKPKNPPAPCRDAPGSMEARGLSECLSSVHNFPAIVLSWAPSPTFSYA